MPVTTPFSDGGKTGASVGLNLGNWVVGFYVDNDRQKPIIMGSIGHTAGATKLENVEGDPNLVAQRNHSQLTWMRHQIQIYRLDGFDKKRNGDQPADSTTAEDENLNVSGDAGEIAPAVPGLDAQHSMVCLLKHLLLIQQVIKYVLRLLILIVDLKMI